MRATDSRLRNLDVLCRLVAAMSRQQQKQKLGSMMNREEDDVESDLDSG